MNETEHRGVAFLMVRLIPALVDKHGPQDAARIFEAAEKALAAVEPLPAELLGSAESFLIEIFNLADRLRSARLGVRSREQLADDRIRMEHGVTS